MIFFLFSPLFFPWTRVTRSITRSVEIFRFILPFETRCWLKYFIRSRFSREKGGTLEQWKLSTKLDTTKMKERSAWIFERLISRRRFRGSSKRPPYISKYIYIYLREIENRISAFLHGLIIFHFDRSNRSIARLTGCQGEDARDRIEIRWW